MITSARLHLVPLSDTEARAILAGERKGRNWAVGYPTDGDSIVAQHHLEHANDPVAYQVVLNATGSVIGGIGFKGPPDASGTIEVGYGIAPEHQGHGLATEALRTLLAAAGNDPKIHMVFAETVIENRARTESQRRPACSSRAPKGSGINNRLIWCIGSWEGSGGGWRMVGHGRGGGGRGEVRVARSAS